MLYLACTTISSVDLAQYGVSLAKDWVSVECGTSRYNHILDTHSVTSRYNHILDTHSVTSRYNHIYLMITDNSLILHLEISAYIAYTGYKGKIEEDRFS